MKRILPLITAIVLCGAVAAQTSNALNFDGYDDYVSTSQSGILGNGARTMEAWIRTTANTNPSAGGSQIVIADMGTFSTGARFTFNVLWSNSIRVEIGGTGVSGTVAVNDGNWHHVAAVYDPSATTKVQLYVDGQSAGSGNFSATPNTSSGNVVLGRRSDAVKYFDGDIEEFRLWDVALTQAQIQANMNVELCSPPSSLVRYYQMNEGTAGGGNANVTTLTDMAGSNHGSLNNFTLSGSYSNWVAGKNLGGSASIDTVTQSVCHEFVYPDSSGTWNITGLYEWIYSIPAANGCDSITYFDLTISTVDTSVVQNGVNISSNAVGATYQWYDCSNWSPITGANSSLYIATANGQYAVEVTQGNCTLMSSCYTVTGIGLDEHQANYNIYPNPVEDMLVFGDVTLSSEVQVYSAQGVLVHQGQIEQGTMVWPQDLPHGVYWVVTPLLDQPVAVQY